MLPVALSAQTAAPAPNPLAVEALKRLRGVDLEANPALKAAVSKVLASVQGTPAFVELIKELKVSGQGPALLSYALAHSAEPSAVEAVRLLVGQGDERLLEAALAQPEGAKLIPLLGDANEKQLVPMLEKFVAAAKNEASSRKSAIHSLAQTQAGAEVLLRLIDGDGLSEELRTAALTDLRTVRWPEIKARVKTSTTDSDAHPAPGLSSIRALVVAQGDVSRGAEVFNRETVGCFRCHLVNGRGTDFGPNLSEIGTKLAKEALFDAILDPSAGISFGYEAWQIELKNGDEAFGLLANETAEEIGIKAQNGLVTHYRKNDIAQRTQQKVSIMPAGLAETMSSQDLVDLVAFLASLRKPEPSSP